jgi:regulator of sigma E protease
MNSMSGFFNGLQVLLGLSFVILLHELGHFVLAKWNGVRVDRFSIFFPPNILKFRKGETEYVLGATPLGGYVSLFGEGLEEDGTKSTDPRAFRNKSVLARMAIMSAGVVMNLGLGLGCFIYAYGQGLEEMSPTIGGVAPGSPAYLADIRPGDEVVSIDGRKNISFQTIPQRVQLSWDTRTFHLELKRSGQEALIPIDVEARREGAASSRTIGISQIGSLILSDPPFLTPAGLSEPPALPDAGLKPDDVVVAAGPEGQAPEPVANSIALERLMFRYGDKPINLVVERKQKEDKGASKPSETPERVTVTLAPNRFVDFGFRLQIEPVAAIRRGSIADRAGFRKGDLIVKVNGRDDFDPMSLPAICHENAGKPMTFEVQRRDAGVDPEKVELTATPDDTLPWAQLAFAGLPLDVPGLGLCYPIRTKIVAINPGSPAEKAGLKAGDIINELTIPGIKKEKQIGKPFVVKFTEKSLGWASAFQALQLFEHQEVKLTVNNSTNPIAITPEPDPSWWHTNRGLRFDLLTHRLPPMGPMDAIRHGADDTVDNILNIYATLRGLMTRRLPMSDLAGPITIVRVAYRAAGSGLVDLIRFLGILSINLAVLNFLPIPPLDGGQMVYLLAEGVRGRPIPESAKYVSFMIGLALVLSLMGFVLIQDVIRW